MAKKNVNVQKGKQGFQKTTPTAQEVKSVTTHPTYAVKPKVRVHKNQYVAPSVSKVFNRFVILANSGKFPALQQYLKSNKLYHHAQNR